MPSIEASLQLYDRFSNKLRSINRSMERTINLAQQLRGAMRQDIQINVRTGNAVAEVERLKRRVDSISGMRADIHIGINAAGAMSEVDRLRDRIRATGSSALNVIINASDVTSEIARIQAQIRSGFTAASIPISLDAADALRRATMMRSQIESRIGTIRAEVKIDVNAAAARSQLEAAIRSASAAGRIVEIPVRLDTARVLIQATLLRAQIMARIGTITAQIQIQMSTQLNSGLVNLRSSMDHLRLAVEELTRTIRSGVPPPGGGGGSGSVVGGLGNISGLLTSLIAMVGGGLLIRGTIGGAMEQQQQIDLFAARTGNAGHGQAIYDAISEQALKYGADVRGSLSGAQSFMSNTMNPEQLKQLNMLSMRLAKLNPYEGMEGASFSMKELMSGDYTSIVERFNMSRGLVRDSEARKAGMNGDVEGFIKGMDKLLNQVNMTQASLDKMLDSPAAKWTRILETFKFKFAESGRAALAALVPVFDRITAWMDSGAFDRFFGALSAGLAIFVQGIAWAMDMMAAGVQFVTAHWEIFAGLLGFISTVLLGAMIVRLWAMIPPILAQAAAWAIAYWPILLIAAAIGIAIYALYSLGYTTQEIVGTIVGMFYWMKVHFENVIIHLKNTWLAWTDFFHNFMINPVYAVKKLFYDLADNALTMFIEMAKGAEEFAGSMVESIGNGINKVLEGVNTMLDALSHIPGLENLSKVNFKVDTSKPNWLSGALYTLQAKLHANVPVNDDPRLKDSKPEPYKTGEDYADAFKLGYDKGYGAVDEIANMINGLNNPGTPYDPAAFANAGKMPAIPATADPKKAGGGSGPKAPKGPKKPNVGKVDSVGKINDTVDISSEDLKLLRELAEMQSIQNFVTLSPVTHITTGDIHSEMDVDEVIRKIENGMNESFESTARGAYGFGG